ncbi:hypothetical protein RCL_jg5021.t1 [Rhizophagus clarus]|uniref:Uncharacterized protein n=1 Tax=Rhizophagus clarus TaxID=94130 RepID=A0A8H3QK73_9GLOM|nr:hypothetical protein RCL_jg5021.t1 [Rhizophagus clarus]
MLILILRSLKASVLVTEPRNLSNLHEVIDALRCAYVWAFSSNIWEKESSLPRSTIHLIKLATRIVHLVFVGERARAIVLGEKQAFANAKNSLFEDESSVVTAEFIKGGDGIEVSINPFDLFFLFEFFTLSGVVLYRYV